MQGTPTAAQCARTSDWTWRIIAGRANPGFLVSHELGLSEAPDAYARFDEREAGWTKVLLHPQQG